MRTAFVIRLVVVSLPATQKQNAELHDFLVRQFLPVYFCLHQLGDQIILGLFSPLQRYFHEIIVKLAAYLFFISEKFLDGCFGVVLDRLGDSIRPVLEQLAICRRNAEKLGDHDDRQRDRNALEQIDLGFPFCLCDQLTHDLCNAWLQFSD